MQCDQIIPLFPFPVFCSKGISLRRVPQMSWLLCLLEDWSICCAKKPCGFKGTWLRNSLLTIPVSVRGQNWLWPGNIRENVSLVRRPAGIKIENKKPVLWFPSRRILTEQAGARDREAEGWNHPSENWLLTRLMWFLLHFWSAPHPPQRFKSCAGLCIKYVSDHLKLRWAEAEECGSAWPCSQAFASHGGGGGRLSLWFRPFAP